MVCPLESWKELLPEAMSLETSLEMENARRPQVYIGIPSHVRRTKTLLEDVLLKN